MQRYLPFLCLLVGLAAYPFFAGAIHHMRALKIGSGDQIGWLYRVKSETGIQGEVFVFRKEGTSPGTLYLAACLRGNNIVCEMDQANGRSGRYNGVSGNFMCSDGKARIFKFFVEDGMPFNPFWVSELFVEPAMGPQTVMALESLKEQKFQGSVGASPCLVQEQWSFLMQNRQDLGQRRT
ncbi:MAG TPA: hypothetical protein PLH11_10660 [Gemmobacter sp.]|nr:hypothetical protein [Gemmobacter sp.]